MIETSSSNRCAKTFVSDNVVYWWRRYRLINTSAVKKPLRIRVCQRWNPVSTWLTMLLPVGLEHPLTHSRNKYSYEYGSCRSTLVNHTRTKKGDVQSNTIVDGAYLESANCQTDIHARGLYDSASQKFYTTPPRTTNLPLFLSWRGLKIDFSSVRLGVLLYVLSHSRFTSISKYYEITKLRCFVRLREIGESYSYNLISSFSLQAMRYRIVWFTTDRVCKRWLTEIYWILSLRM